MIEAVKNLAGKMRLHGIHHGVERRLDEAVKSNLHPADFLRLVLEDELLARKNAYASSLARRAKFRSQCDLENWDQNRPRGLTKTKLKDITAGNFFRRKESLIICGPTGVGKTHLAIAIGRMLCQQEITVAFWSVNLLLEQIQAERAAGKYLPAIKRIIKPDVIILDDFGLRSYSHDEAVTLLEILEERYTKSVVIVTSQVEPLGWKSLFQDSVISDSIVDRIIGPSDKITLTGDSFRQTKKSN
jgi:DNA replication protein DnaC